MFGLFKKKRENVTYSLKNGKVTNYVGSTNNLNRRINQHKRSGKVFNNYEIHERGLTKNNALKSESRRIRKHENKYGQPPIHNLTKNGAYGPSSKSYVFKRKQQSDRLKRKYPKHNYY